MAIGDGEESHDQYCHINSGEYGLQQSNGHWSGDAYTEEAYGPHKQRLVESMLSIEGYRKWCKTHKGQT